jgi:hypothetical protein
MEPETTAILTVDFARNTREPARIFRAIGGYLETFALIDEDLLGTIGQTLSAEIILLDVEAGSLRVRLGQILDGVPDDLLAKGEIRPIVGHFLVQAKHAYLRAVGRMDKAQDLGPIVDARAEIVAIANDLGVAGGAEYRAPSTQKIAARLEGLSSAGKDLLDADKVYYTADARTEELDVSVLLDSEALGDLLAARRIENEARMLLKIKRPDFLGKAKWEFRLGSRVITASFAHEDWLDQFRRKEVILRPGDALDARVRAVALYTSDNELIREAHTILEVLSVVPEEPLPRLPGP